MGDGDRRPGNVTRRLHNPATGEEIEVDGSDPEAMRRAMDRLVETPGQWLVRVVRRGLGRLVARLRGWIGHARP
jgi:hypothetical protein